MEKIVALLALVGATVGMALGAAAGAVVAVALSAETARARVLTGLGGFLLGIVGAPTVGGWFDLADKVSPGVALLLALFGMPVAAEGLGMVRDGTLRRVFLAMVAFLNRKKGGQE